MEIRTLRRNIFQRIFGIPATRAPSDDGCWEVSGRKLLIDLNRVPELSKPGGAIRLEGKNLHDRVLVIRADDGTFRSFRNRCRHMGRRLDPVPGTETVQCCSVSKTTYSYDGQVLYGPAKEPVNTFPVEVIDNKLVISL